MWRVTRVRNRPASPVAFPLCLRLAGSAMRVAYLRSSGPTRAAAAKHDPIPDTRLTRNQAQHLLIGRKVTTSQRSAERPRTHSSRPYLDPLRQCRPRRGSVQITLEPWSPSALPKSWLSQRFFPAAGWRIMCSSASGKQAVSAISALPTTLNDRRGIHQVGRGSYAIQAWSVWLRAQCSEEFDSRLRRSAASRRRRSTMPRRQPRA